MDLHSMQVAGITAEIGKVKGCFEGLLNNYGGGSEFLSALEGISKGFNICQALIWLLHRVKPDDPACIELLKDVINICSYLTYCANCHFSKKWGNEELLDLLLQRMSVPDLHYQCFALIINLCVDNQDLYKYALNNGIYNKLAMKFKGLTPQNMLRYLEILLYFFDQMPKNLGTPGPMEQIAKIIVSRVMECPSASENDKLHVMNVLFSIIKILESLASPLANIPAVGDWLKQAIRSVNEDVFVIAYSFLGAISFQGDCLAMVANIDPSIIVVQVSSISPSPLGTIIFCLTNLLIDSESRKALMQKLFSSNTFFPCVINALLSVIEIKRCTWKNFFTSLFQYSDAKQIKQLVDDYQVLEFLHLAIKSENSTTIVYGLECVIVLCARWTDLKPGKHADSFVVQAIISNSRFADTLDALFQSESRSVADTVAELYEGYLPHE